ncbi:MAG: hypothetical protein Q7T35_10265 [Nitrosomonas sp.]|nr:hypothetical protein [Nitrosomonas sp.]
MNIREQYQLLAEHGAMFLLSMYLIATMPAPPLATVGALLLPIDSMNARIMMQQAQILQHFRYMHGR